MTKDDIIKTILGVLIAVASSIAGYSLKTVIDVETRLAVLENNSGLSAKEAARIATLEEEMEQAKGELDTIWKKYNKEQEDKNEWIIEYGELMSRIILLEYEIKHIH